MRETRSIHIALIAIASTALLLAGCRKEAPAPVPATKSGPVIIISVDTLRADYLPVYGATAVRTPVFDALAADSIVFDNAYSHVPLTFPSHVTVLTGSLPADNGVRNNLGYRLDPTIPTIPTRLKSRGYETGAAVSSYVLRGALGLGKLFDHYDDAFEESEGSVGEIQRPGPETVAKAIEWIGARGDRPFFYFLHIFEPHTPYEPPEPFRTEYKDSLYDGEIAAADAAIAPLIEKLKSSGVYDRATIIFMSDHGEGLGDHGEWEHGVFLYREAIHVPLFLKLPDSEMAGTRVRTAVGLLDLFATIVGEGEGQGVSLVSIARGDGPERRIFSETMYPRIHLGWSDTASLADDKWQYIDAPNPELYALGTDPGEKSNVLFDNRRVYAALRKEMEAFDRSLEAPTEISPEEAAKLSALGYLGGTSGNTTGDLPDPKDRIGDMNLFLEAGNLMRLGRFEEAIEGLEGVLERNPTFADAWTVLGKAYQGMGDLEKALDAYKKKIDLAPSLAAGSALSVAEIYLALGQLDKALAHAELGRELHPGPTGQLVASISLANDDLATAEREALALASDPARRDEGMIIIAQVRIRQKRFDEALKILNDVASGLSGKKPPANLWFARGDVMARGGNISEAVLSFGEEIALYPQNRESYVRLAVVHLLSGSEAEAIRTFESMLKANPSASSCMIAADAFRQIGRADLSARWEARAKAYQ